jgi:hypothetical protein
VNDGLVRDVDDAGCVVTHVSDARYAVAHADVHADHAGVKYGLLARADCYRRQRQKRMITKQWSGGVGLLVMSEWSREGRCRVGTCHLCASGRGGPRGRRGVCSVGLCRGE